MKSTYYVAVHTMEMYDEARYKIEAEELERVLRDVFCDVETVAALTKGAATSCHTESEIATTPESGLIGRCVVELDAEARVQLDKSKLTTLLKKKLNLPNLKVEKKSVIEPPA